MNFGKKNVAIRYANEMMVGSASDFIRCPNNVQSFLSVDGVQGRGSPFGLQVGCFWLSFEIFTASAAHSNWRPLICIHAVGRRVRALAFVISRHLFFLFFFFLLPSGLPCKDGAAVLCASHFSSKSFNLAFLYLMAIESSREGVDVHWRAKWHTKKKRQKSRSLRGGTVNGNGGDDASVRLSSHVFFSFFFFVELRLLTRPLSVRLSAPATFSIKW